MRSNTAKQGLIFAIVSILFIPDALAQQKPQDKKLPAKTVAFSDIQPRPRTKDRALSPATALRNPGPSRRTGAVSGQSLYSGWRRDGSASPWVSHTSELFRRCSWFCVHCLGQEAYKSDSCITAVEPGGSPSDYRLIS